MCDRKGRGYEHVDWVCINNDIKSGTDEEDLILSFFCEQEKHVCWKLKQWVEILGMKANKLISRIRQLGFGRLGQDF